MTNGGGTRDSEHDQCQHPTAGQKPVLGTSIFDDPETMQQRIRRLWIPLFVVADLAILPMLHIGLFPYKFSYLLIVYMVVRRFPIAIPVRRVFTIFALLFMILTISWTIRVIMSGEFSITNAQSIMAVIVMAPIAFAFGWNTSPKVTAYVPWVIVSFSFLSLFVTVFWSRLIPTAFGRLYGYQQEYLGFGDVLQRPGGLHQNPHITALFLSILLIYVAIGVRFSIFPATSWKAILSVSFASIIILLVGSRSELITTFLTSMFIVYSAYIQRSASNMFFILFASTLVAAPLLLLFVNQLQYGTLVFETLPIAISNAVLDPLDRFHGIGRFFYAWINPRFLDAFTTSPLSVLIGHGPEGKAGTGMIGLSFHNDYASLIVASGILGMLVFLPIIRMAYKVSLVLLAPFIFAAMSNAFILSPTHFILFMIILGIGSRALESTTTESKQVRPPLEPANTMTQPRNQP